MKSEAFANMSLEQQAVARSNELAQWARVLAPTTPAKRVKSKRLGLIARVLGLFSM